MKYLIITPDGVGSTFLQRAITLILHLNGKNVVNTHEITNGLTIENGKICRPSKPNYEQNMEKIIKILKHRDYPCMVSRLAKYHLDLRNDDKFLVDLLDFIKQFYDKIIICKRKNIFEYALSWGLRHNTGYLNVFNLKQKREVRKKSFVDVNFFKKKLNEYKKYISWADENFLDADTIFYEDLIGDPEKVLADIGIDPKNFKNNFGFNLKEFIHLEYNLHEHRINNTKSVNNMVKDIRKIAKVKSYLNNLVQNKIMPAGTMPIKNTSLALKKQIIINYDQCANCYKEFCRHHNWADQTIMEFDFWQERFV